MAYSRSIYDYVMDYPSDSYVEQQSWVEHRPSRSDMIPRTIAPTELYQQPDDYSSYRSYDIAPPYSTSSRATNNPTYITYPDAAPVRSSRQYRRSDERISQRQYYEQPTVTIEVCSQRPRSQRYYCDYEECVDKHTGVRRSVGRKADLRRHVSSVHGTPHIDCEFSKCWRRGEDGFCRHDHYREHLRGYHNKDVPKQEKKRSS